MAIPRSMGWLVVTGVAVLTLVALSMFALDRPDVVWAAGKAQCPHCRADVHAYGRRCPTCREEFDWVPTSDEASPVCARCLSPAQDEWVRERRRVLGEDKAAARLAAALHVPTATATAYLAVVGRGQCGYCGGAGVDLGATEAKDRPPCPVCLGDRRCIACGGDRRVLVGLEVAAVEAARYDALAQTLLAPNSPPDLVRRQLKDAASVFLRRQLGTAEVEHLVFWPEFPPTAARPSRPAAAAAAERLTLVMGALAGE